MPRPPAKFAAAIFGMILGGASLATMARGETPAADNCLTAPKGETPAGSHWRYHIDHVNKRNCWYLRGADGDVSQTVPQNRPAPVEPAKPSIADARAEFVPQTKAREDNAVVATPANSAATGTDSANQSIWNPAAAVATRWPDVPAATPAPAAAPPTPAASAPAAVASTDATTASIDPARAVIPSVPLANLSIRLQPETIFTLIAATLGALAFAGAAALITRRRRTLRIGSRVARATWGPLSETTDDDRIILSDYPSPEHRDYRPRFARNAGPGKASVNRPPEFAPRAPRYARR